MHFYSTLVPVMRRHNSEEKGDVTGKSNTYESIFSQSREYG